MENISFSDEIFIEFKKLLDSTCHQNVLENMNRFNKGELFALHYLLNCNSEVFPSELSTALDVTTGRISALLSSLEKKGQITREIDINNRRNILVAITDKGRKRVEEEIYLIKERLSNIFIEMGETEAKEFLRLLKIFFELSLKYIPDISLGE